MRTGSSVEKVSAMASVSASSSSVISSISWISSSSGTTSSSGGRVSSPAASMFRPASFSSSFSCSSGVSCSSSSAARSSAESLPAFLPFSISSWMRSSLVLAGLSPSALPSAASSASAMASSSSGVGVVAFFFVIPYHRMPFFSSFGGRPRAGPCCPGGAPRPVSSVCNPPAPGIAGCCRRIAE